MRTLSLAGLPRFLLTFRWISKFENGALTLTFRADFLIFLLCRTPEPPRNTIDTFYLVLLASTTGGLLVTATDFRLLTSVTR